MTNFTKHSSELGEKKLPMIEFLEKTLDTVGPLPQNKLEFAVVLEESFAKHKCSGSPSEATER